MLRKLTAILGTCLIVIVGLCYFFLYNSTESKIKLNDKANVYFLTSEGIYTLVTEDNKINLLEKSEQKLAEFVYYYYPRASFDNRYLLDLFGNYIISWLMMPQINSALNSNRFLRLR